MSEDIGVPAFPVPGDDVCPVCDKPIEEADLSSTGYVNYHKGCNLVS